MKINYVKSCFLILFVNIFIFFGILQVHANDLTKVDFISTSFDGVFQVEELKQILESNPNITNDLYDSLTSEKIVKKKFILSDLVVIGETKKLPNPNKKVKVISAKDWFFGLMTPVEEEKFDSKLHIIGGFDDDCNKIKIIVLCLQNFRYFTQEIEIASLKEDNIVDKLTEAIINGLRMSDKLIPTFADRVFDVEKSKVEYFVRSTKNKQFKIIIDYDSMHEFIQSVDFDSFEEIENGLYEGCIPSKENNDICIELNFENNELISKKIYPKELKNIDKPFRLTAASNKDYDIYFDFNYVEGSELEVKISPSLNPYLPYGYKMEEGSKDVIILDKNYDLTLECDNPDKAEEDN